MNSATYSNNAMTNLWNYLQGLSLSAADSRWLADRLIENTEKMETKNTSRKKLVFPHIDDNFKPSENVLSMVLGPLPEWFDVDKEMEKMWEDRAK